MFKKIQFVLGSEYIIYSVLFLLSYFLMLINNGMYWDTLTVYNQYFNTVAKSSTEGGNPFSGYFVYALINFSPPLWARLLIGSLYLFSGVLLNIILKRNFLYERADRVVVVTLFLILPVNFSKVCLIVFPYAVGYFAFFLGVYCFYLCLDQHNFKKWLYRVLSLALFYFAFIMLNSLLIFYLVFLISPLLSSKLRRIALNGRLINVLRYLDFILLPIVFFGIKKIFFTPYASYQGYNEVTLAGLLSALKGVPLQIWDMVVEMFYTSFGRFEVVVFALLCILVFVALISVSSREYIGKNIQLKGVAAIFVMSLVFMWLAVFPYAAVGKPIIFADWWSRNQILMPLGLSLLFYVLISLVARVFYKKFAYFIFSILVSFCVVKNGVVYYAYLLDDFKQQSLVEEFKSNVVIKNNTSFIVKDLAYELNTFDRIYRFYEYSGLMRQAFGNQERFAVNELHYHDSMEPFKGAELDSRMNIKGHILNRPNVLITISLSQDYENVLSQLFWSYVFRDFDTFEKLKLNLLDVNTRFL